MNWENARHGDRGLRHLAGLGGDCRQHPFVATIISLIKSMAPAYGGPEAIVGSIGIAHVDVFWWRSF